MLQHDVQGFSRGGNFGSSGTWSGNRPPQNIIAAGCVGCRASL